MIKVIVFDIGDVLLKYDRETYYKYLSRNNDIDKELYLRSLDKLAEKIDSGKMTLKKFEKEFATAIGIDKSEVGYKEALKEGAKLNVQVVKLAKRLSKRYRLAILSNVDAGSYEIIKRNFIDTTMFEQVFLSYKIKATKPSRKIYSYVVKKLEVKPGEVLFIDDINENVEGARKFGINSILFRSPRQLEMDIKRIL